LTGHVGAKDLCNTQDLDALIIASPPEFHEEALRSALTHRIPCFTEKPLIWEGAGSAKKVTELITAFKEASVPLWVHCQWPETLPSFFNLFPSRRDTLPKKEFRMRLSPTSCGLEMLPDSLPHLLSLCQALVPGEKCRISQPHFIFEGEEKMQVRFLFQARSQSWPCQFDLKRVLRPPRPAGFGWDGDYALREIELPKYKQFFKAQNRRIEVSDPLVSLLSSFFDSIRKGKLGKILPDPADRAEMMESLILAATKAWEEETQ
jgi:hypothetical protein